MKKFFIVLALTLAITASTAQAAVFTFGSLPAATDITNFTIDGVDVSATFTDFTNQWNGTLYDYYLVPNAGATILFDTAALVSEVVSADWGTEQPFSGTAYLGSTAFAFTDFSQIIGNVWTKITIDGTFGISKIVASATPLPGAVWLLGSGLVGLVGLRRKFRQ